MSLVVVQDLCLSYGPKVLFDNADRPLLADFGIAMMKRDHARITGDGLALGSATNMAPEQARAEPVDGRADIYSLGVLVYQMVTGRKPFIEDEKLMPVLFAEKWDVAAKNWTGPEKTWPDVRDGVRLFQRKVLAVDEDAKTKLVTVAVTWTDANLAAKWTTMLVDRLNTRMRDRALRDAERNVAFLRQELSNATIVTMQESVARLLEREMQKMMLARGNPEYSFRVVDRASVPKWRYSPKRIQVVIFGTLAGGMIAVFFAVFRGRSRRAHSQSSAA